MPRLSNNNRKTLAISKATISKTSNPDYSIVIPVFNEAENVAQLHKELIQVMRFLGSYEIIFVNDSSRDNTLNELRKLKGIKIINLNTKYGQSTALDAGFKEAKGNVIITLDGDLQNDPRDIPFLLEKLRRNNLDVVAGWRKNRKDKGSINLISRIGRILRGIFINDHVHDSGCMLRVYRKEAAKSLELHGEMHRYILALLRWKGFRIGELEVNHRPRIHGTSKYKSSKAIRGFIDLLYIWFIQKYSQRPLHIYGYLSLVTLFLGILSGFWSIYAKIFNGLGFNRNGWFFVSFFLILASIMFFSFGIVINFLIKINFSASKYERRYYIRDIIEN